jgi:hypothetical protein
MAVSAHQTDSEHSSGTYSPNIFFRFRVMFRKPKTTGTVSEIPINNTVVWGMLAILDYKNLILDSKTTGLYIRKKLFGIWRRSG